MGRILLSDLLQLASSLRPRRVLNYFLLIHAYIFSRVSGIPLVWARPPFVSIEPTNRCNLKCTECPAGNGTMTRARGDLDPELFRQIVDAVANDAIYLNFYFQGEPLLNPHFCDMVKYARSRALYVTTSSNAHLLSAEMALKIVESGLSRIIISFDGPDQASYETYRHGGNWTSVMQGVRHLVEARKAAKSSHPLIELQCLLLRSNENRLDEIRQVARETGADRIVFKTIQLLKPAQASDLLPLQKVYSRYLLNADGTHALKRRPRAACRRAFTTAVFTFDARLVPCCYDKDADYVLGDLKTSSFLSAWKGEERLSFLKTLLRKRSDIGMCCNCGD